MKTITLKKYVTKQLIEKYKIHNKNKLIKNRRFGFSYNTQVSAYIIAKIRYKVKQELKKYKFY